MEVVTLRVIVALIGSVVSSRVSQVEKVEKELLQHGIMLEKHGGDIQSVEISALKGLGMDELIDSILLQAEFMDLRTEVRATVMP